MERRAHNGGISHGNDLTIVVGEHPDTVAYLRHQGCPNKHGWEQLVQSPDLQQRFKAILLTTKCVPIDGYVNQV